MAIVWRKELQIDSGRIDDDHRRLISIINKFEVGVYPQDLHEAILCLLEYGKLHFSREERIMAEVGYPQYSNHINEHKGLINDLGVIIKGYNSAIGSNGLEIVRKHTSHLLRHWLIDHIIKCDVPIRTFIGQKAHPCLSSKWSSPSFPQF
jgi:hemerythrin